eukprot:c24182_g1_i1 orf=403-963(-)
MAAAAAACKRLLPPLFQNACRALPNCPQFPHRHRHLSSASSCLVKPKPCHPPIGCFPMPPCFSSLAAASGTSSSQARFCQRLQTRHVYVRVGDDFDFALRMYSRKMNQSGVEKKLREKMYYIKPSERRKLAKHYKKLNRARRELSKNVKIVKAQMEYRGILRRKMRAERRKSVDVDATQTQGSESL